MVTFPSGATLGEDTLNEAIKTDPSYPSTDNSSYNMYRKTSLANTVLGVVAGASVLGMVVGVVSAYRSK
jgi:hypothetical protein